MQSFLNNLPKPFMVLAPMDDVTETVFRRVVAECACPDLFFTEFVNVDALQSAGRTAALRRLKYTEAERPLIAQIWGQKPENFYKTAQELVEMGFDGVDINFGCPDKAVVKNGCGGGMIKYPEGAVEIINATREGLAGKLPLSVKTRIGFNSFDERWLTAVLEQKLNMLSIHLRTVKEMSKVPAHWELADRVRELRDEVSPSTLLVGNGDVSTRDQAEDLAKKHGYDGIMIGRGVFQNPYVFASDFDWDAVPAKEKLKLFRRHVELFSCTWQEGERPIAPLNKFCKIYVSGFDGAKEARVKLMNCHSIKELQLAIDDLMSNL
jgi:tRNA-dihydrouridine synthase